MPKCRQGALEGRIASMANPTEMIGEMEIVATSRFLKRETNVLVWNNSILKCNTGLFDVDESLMVRYESLTSR